MNVLKRIKRISPGSLVTAAFIGPGTITTCIKAGYTQSYSLLSVMIVATIIAIIIQYYAAKVGIITQCGVSRNIRMMVKSKIGRTIACILVISAIFIGNCAFEAGNITGAALGVQLLLNSSSSAIILVGITILVGVLLWKGHLVFIQKVLEVFVLLMAICFVVATILIAPSFSDILCEMLSLDFNGNILLIGALIGTTVGPYSIFLHSEAASQHWHSPSDLKEMMIDTILSISIGGLISCCIIIVSATTAKTLEMQELTLMNYSKSLELPLGAVGHGMFLIGLFAAGITSAITAPLAAAYTITEMCIEKAVGTKNRWFRFVWATVLLCGLLVSLVLGSSPANLILFAQYANALILPIVVSFLLYCLNSENMREYKNKAVANCIMLLMILICIFLGLRYFIY